MRKIWVVDLLYHHTASGFAGFGLSGFGAVQPGDGMQSRLGNISRIISSSVCRSINTLSGRVRCTKWHTKGFFSFF